MTEQARSRAPEDARPVYSISVAAELAELAVPTLRLYEEHGLVTPARTDGGTRRYSADDVERIRRVSGLVEDGVTLAAVQMVLDLQDRNRSLTDANRALRDRNAALRKDNACLRADD
ncbi:MerR family transcriptional regulator [Phycicoccus sp. M110.8]|uniref:MerR family transcriptional regulator n=1 Tax=Phycicoccus sp. M110.8 TaxID=3075433 RepID=UPI0028FD5934|nr:MerR family transcriptional regulator [Phycicoccus sp. M110.8]MDU0314385.1 MerR family transcriptional regulator [Phycicoccus sp. M110.8]